MKTRLVFVVFAVGVFPAFAADPVVEKAVQDAQKKFPPGDYENAPSKAFPRTQGRVSFEIHAVAPKLDGTKRWYRYDHTDGTTEQLAVDPEVLLRAESIKAAWTEHNQDGEPVVRIKFTAAGTEKFGEVTQRLVNQRIAILLEGQVVSAPVIRTPIYGGDALLTARSEESAVEMAAKLNPPNP